MKKKWTALLMAMLMLCMSLFTGCAVEQSGESQTEVYTIDENGSYTTPEDVALYLHTYGDLPDNFITKKEAQALGWDNKKGNLWEVAEDLIEDIAQALDAIKK